MLALKKIFTKFNKEKLFITPKKKLLPTIHLIKKKKNGKKHYIEIKIYKNYQKNFL